MRLYLLEIKRICKSKMTIILLSLSLILAVFMAYVPTTHHPIEWENADGTKTVIKGFDRIHYYQQMNDTIYGEVTPEKVKQAVERRQKVLRKYDSEYGENVPPIEYYQEMAPYTVFTRGVKELQADRKTGISPGYLEIDLARIDSYYEEMEPRLESVIRMEQSKHPAALEAAKRKFAKVKTPYFYYFGVDSDELDYEILLAFLLTIFGVVLAAPVFSDDVQTGADDIQRCTKNGGVRFAAARMFAYLTVSVLPFAFCLALQIILLNCFFGWEGAKTSIQMLTSITALVPWNTGQLQWGIAGYTAAFFLCTLLFTMRVSSRAKSNLVSLSFSLFSVFLPIIVGYAGLPKTLENLLACILPGGGIGLGNAILYELVDYKFLHIGACSFWLPDAMLFTTCAEILLFGVLAVVSYCGRNKR